MRLHKQTIWQQWSEDLQCVFARDPAATNKWVILFTYPGVHAMIFYRVSNRLYLAGWHIFARILSYIARTLTNVDIHPGATIGKRMFIDHGAGVVIGETAEIGDDVTLYHGVTLGGTTWNKEKRHPTLGNNVLIGAGAKILGAITLGNNVRVGANSVVLKNVPDCCTVIGIPGRIIQSKGIKIQMQEGIDLDHHIQPDPIGKAINCLIERIDQLETEQKALRKNQIDHCSECEADEICHTHQVEQPLQKAVG